MFSGRICGRQLMVEKCFLLLVFCNLRSSGFLANCWLSSNCFWETGELKGSRMKIPPFINCSFSGNRSWLWYCDYLQLNCKFLRYAWGEREQPWFPYLVLFPKIMKEWLSDWVVFGSLKSTLIHLENWQYPFFQYCNNFAACR